MTPKLQGEIEKYLSKKNPYYSRFSTELIDHLNTNYSYMPDIKSQWYMLKNNLTEDDIPTCKLPKCDKKVKWNLKRSEFDKGCCSDHNKRITSIENFGTEHPNQSKKQQEKVKSSMRKTYGVDYITQTDKHKESVKKTVNKRYGVDSVFQAEDVRDKIRETNIERYGVEEVMSNPEIREKAKQTMLKRYGVEHSLSSPAIRAKVNKTNLERYGSIFPMKNDELLEKRMNYIVETYDSYSPIVRKEDTNKYHYLDLIMEAENHGEVYHHFFDPELKHSSRQVKWIVDGEVDKVVGEIEFGNITFKDRDDFILKNSLYTKDSEIRQNMGVFSYGELVAVISGYENKTQYEITRFITKIGVKFEINVLGEFIEYLGIDKPIIITFDRRFTSINQPELEELGFEFVGGTEPNLFYVSDDEIINVRNKTLLERADLNEFIQIYDCGKLVFKRV